MNLNLIPTSKQTKLNKTAHNLLQHSSRSTNLNLDHHTFHVDLIINQYMINQSLEHPTLLHLHDPIHIVINIGKNAVDKHHHQHEPIPNVILYLQLSNGTVKIEHLPNSTQRLVHGYLVLVWDISIIPILYKHIEMEVGIMHNTYLEIFHTNNSNMITNCYLVLYFLLFRNEDLAVSRTSNILAMVYVHGLNSRITLVAIITQLLKWIAYARNSIYLIPQTSKVVS